MAEQTLSNVTVGQFGALVASELSRWKAIVQKTGFKSNQ